jgi:hypothetical protein
MVTSWAWQVFNELRARDDGMRGGPEEASNIKRLDFCFSNETDNAYL